MSEREKRYLRRRELYLTICNWPAINVGNVSHGRVADQRNSTPEFGPSSRYLTKTCPGQRLQRAGGERLAYRSRGHATAR